MTEEKNESHSHGCCGGAHHHEHHEDFFKIELTRQIDEFLKNRDRHTLTVHEDDCSCCGNE